MLVLCILPTTALCIVLILRFQDPMFAGIGACLSQSTTDDAFQTSEVAAETSGQGSG